MRTLSRQYNEGINDLLGKGDVDAIKHEIKHEKGRTIVTDAVIGESTSHLSLTPPPLTRLSFLQLLSTRQRVSSNC